MSVIVDELLGIEKRVGETFPGFGCVTAEVVECG
jgi:hypothetical protein